MDEKKVVLKPVKKQKVNVPKGESEEQNNESVKPIPDASQKETQVITPLKKEKPSNPMLRPSKKKIPPTKPFKNIDTEIGKRKEVGTFEQLQ